MELRKRHKDAFEKKHGVKLGFMGFFVRACVAALKEIPSVNAEIDGGDIIYKNFYNVSVAVGTDKGLVVPVVRDADTMTLAEIEAEIGRLGALARDGKLSMDDLQGGTFTISNGGVYGLADVDPDPQPAAIRRARHAPHRGASGCGRRQDHRPPDDVPRPQLRPPPRRRHAKRSPSSCASRKRWKTPSACCSTSNLDHT